MPRHWCHMPSCLAASEMKSQSNERMLRGRDRGGQELVASCPCGGACMQHHTACQVHAQDVHCVPGMVMVLKPNITCLHAFFDRQRHSAHQELLFALQASRHACVHTSLVNEAAAKLHPQGTSDGVFRWNALNNKNYSSSLRPAVRHRKNLSYPPKHYSRQH